MVGSLVAGSLAVGSFVAGSLMAGSLVAVSLVAGFLAVGSLVVDLVAFVAVSDFGFGGAEENERSIVYEVNLCATDFSETQS